MDNYKVKIQFKNDKYLDFELAGEEGLRENLAKSWASNDKILYLADYVISANDILYIKIEGEKVEKPSG